MGAPATVVQHHRRRDGPPPPPCFHETRIPIRFDIFIYRLRRLVLPITPLVYREIFSLARRRSRFVSIRPVLPSEESGRSRPSITRL